jgi:hypothetical protein
MINCPVNRSNIRGRSAVAAGSLAALVAAGLVPGGAQAAVPQALGPQSCPAPFPTANLERDQPVRALTVSQGTQPDRLTGRYVGTIEDGIAPGLDLIIVRLAGSVVTDSDGDVDRGIWAGMSGSPVYAKGGRLIGAVSYGLSWSPSDYAGVTPADQMYKLRDYEKDNARTVAVPDRLAARMAVDGASSQQVDSGMHRLPMPVSVSGLAGRRLQRAAKMTGFTSHRVISGSTARTSDEVIPLQAGGNVTATGSYGDATIGGTGTVTAVCGDQVLAFGHPFFFSGRSSNNMHGADALYIQRDDVFGSFKVANPAAPTGTVTQDRLAGILGVDGRLPDSTSIVSRIRSGDRSRTGTTQVSEPKILDFALFVHLLSNLDRVFDQIGDGSAQSAWTMTLRRADGSLTTYARDEVYANEEDLTFPMVFDVLEDLWRIQENRFEAVAFVSIGYDSTLSEQFRAYRIGRTLVLQNGRWVKVGPDDEVVAGAGRQIRLQVRLLPRGEDPSDTRTLRLAVDVPSAAKGQHAELAVLGGDSYRGGRGEVTSLDEMLEQMSAEPNNGAVLAILRFSRRSGLGDQTASKRVSAPLSGSQFFEVRVRR